MSLLQFRSIGGIYKIAVQARNDYKCAVNWLAEAIPAAVGHSRVYDRWPLETVSIAPGTEFITYVYDHSDPDKYTHKTASSRVKQTWLYFEILVWKQGINYVGIEETAADIMEALDVGETTRSEGVINGAERYQFKAGAVSMEGG